MPDACSDAIVGDLMGVLSGLTGIEVACYLAGCSVNELLFHREKHTPFRLTIRRG